MCAHLEPIANRTRVVIWQHPKERNHPHGTVRLLRRGLKNITVHRYDFARPEQALLLPEHTSLLFPGADALELSSLAVAARPGAVLILDGTWAQARAMLRSAPWLQRLPKVRLSPPQPSCYRIRREPNDTAISTLEAVAMALDCLEPNTPGIERLLAGLARMVDVHLELRRTRPSVSYTMRRRRRMPASRLPRALHNSLGGWVLMHAETIGQEHALELVQLVALRLATGEVFSRVVQTARPVDDARRDQLQLCAEDLAGAVSLDALAVAWRHFVRPGERPVLWNNAARAVLDALLPTPTQPLLLNGVYTRVYGRRPGKLDDLSERDGLLPRFLGVPGRAQRRLGTCFALIERMRMGSSS